jgi:hypothetical protein
MTVYGPIWFGFALLVCGAHALHLRGWRRERRAHLAWWKSYDARAQQRHDEFMRALDQHEAAAASDDNDEGE